MRPHFYRVMLVVIAICTLSTRAWALDGATLQQLASSDSDTKIAAIARIAASADTQALPVLQALLDDALSATPAGQVLITANNQTRDALTQHTLPAPPADAAAITINNRVRSALESALAALKLFAPGTAVRLAAAQQLQRDANPDLLPLVQKALQQETDEEIRTTLQIAAGGIELHSPDAATRIKAVQMLSQSSRGVTKVLLTTLLEKDADGHYTEPNAQVRAAAQTAIALVERRLKTAEMAGNIFSGISLGSILLLTALGLAIIYGLMGVINMAHGELLMIGAYATYSVQALFKHYAPQYFDYYLVLAIPAAFIVAAVVGMILERGIIRWLYGRPLETLLATWGISLILIQTVRTLFGAQNVEVANPAWLSGGVTVLGNLVLPYNRIAIIGFALAVLFSVWALLNRTALGLNMRAVTQNRRMADCLGVPTGRIDCWAFGLGAGVAGLGGCALSQISNVGPELGQNYIVDSFMVVVLGGVGQIAGTVYAALGLGVVNKFLEPFAGAVLAKIAVLVFIILFIQKRPQGIFALKGRAVDH